MGLTKKQEMFCVEYVKCDNKSQAYRIAYSTSKMSDDTIHNNAYKLSENNDIATRIGELKETAAKVAEKEFKIDSKELLRHLNILRNSNISEYVDFVEITVPIPTKNEAGELEVSYKTERILQFKPFEELTKEQLMCIESIKEGRYGIELKLHGKDWTIDKIAKHIGFYEKHQKAKIDISNDDLDKRIAELKKEINE